MAQILKGIVIAVGRTVASAFTQAYNNIAYGTFCSLTCPVLLDLCMIPPLSDDFHGIDRLFYAFHLPLTPSFHLPFPLLVAGAKGAPEAGAAAINRAFKKPITTEEARQILDINETVALADAEEVCYNQFRTMDIFFAYETCETRVVWSFRPSHFLHRHSLS